MKHITIKPVGKISVKNPKLSTVYDIVSTWTTSPSQAHIGRLCAAAIGVCCEDARLPVYDNDQARPIAYGGLCMDTLLQAGCKPNEIIEKGMEVLTMLAPMLLKEDEVKKK